MQNKGLLLVMSGPSGVGKGTVCGKLLERNPQIKLSVSVTTRSPRPGEVEGVSYFYRTEEEFARMIENDEFLEYMNVFGKNHYGTPKAFVENQRLAGNDILLEIDVKGALKVKEKCPDAVMIFIAPPSMEILRNRLTGRGTECQEVIERRLAEASCELCRLDEYGYVVVNNDLETAVNHVESIICAEKLRVINNSELVQQLKGDTQI